MKVFIRGTGAISPQRSFGHPPFLAEPVVYKGNRLRCIEPDYRLVIDPKQIRRMSRIIKMGVAAAMECLREAGTAMPGAIITGTAYGCLEDTGVFMEKMAMQHEELLTPTAFIQSTHNTVAAQVALLLGCNNYNNTYVHRGFSFESALLDAMMYLLEGEAEDVLAGSVDEITDFSHAILERFHLYKKDTVQSDALIDSMTAGTIAGEGAAFFLLSGLPSTSDYAVLEGLHTFYKPAAGGAVETEIRGFLERQSTAMEDIDLVLTGRNGDVTLDQVYDALDQSVFNGKAQAHFKPLCGEYPTAVSFGSWVAANILKTGVVPPVLATGSNAGMPVKRILLYNHSNNIHHSVLLFSAC